MVEDTLRLFRELDIDIDPRARTGALSVSKIQSLEIVKAVSYHSKVIVMDEPTSSLTRNEVEHLFSIMNRLRSQGVSIVYISHKMEEILRISDDVTIMRDGKYVGTWQSRRADNRFDYHPHGGTGFDGRYPERANVPGETRMQVHQLSPRIRNRFQNVSFELRRGDIGHRRPCRRTANGIG